jgi:hypothetical protein
VPEDREGPAGLGKSIPDIVGPNSLTEIKDALNLANTKQLKIQTQAAIDADKSFKLIVSPRTTVITKPLRGAVRDTGGTIQVFDPATGSLRLWQP